MRPHFLRLSQWVACFSAVFIWNLAAQAGVTFQKSQLEVSVAPGFNHVPASLPYTLDPAPFDENSLTVTSDVAWVTATVDAAGNRINLQFSTASLIATYTATIRVSDGATVKELFVTAKVTPLDIYRLVDDPLRSATYGIHRDGINAGAVVSYNPVTKAPVSCITVGSGPCDFVINDASTELLVINSVSKSISVIDLPTFSLKETLNLSTYDSWGDPDDTSANIELGPGNIIYYLDGSWGPILRVLNRSTMSVIQSIRFDGSAPSNDTGFQDIAVNKERTRLVAMPQYGWSAGGHSPTVGQYTINPNGTVNFVKQTTINNYLREPFEAPALMREDGQVAILKTAAVDPSNTNIIPRTFPTAVWSMSPDGGVVATSDKLYSYETGLALYTIPGITTSSYSAYLHTYAQAFTSDYTRFVYFKSSTRTLEVINLIETIGLDALGRALTPSPDSVVTSPNKLIWGALAGVDQYDLYLGTSSAEVNAAATDSPLYLGRINGSSYVLNQVLAPGTYHWRVDPVVPEGPEHGNVYSFTVSDVSLDAPRITLSSVTGHSDIQATLQIDSANSGVAWNASATDSWVSFAQDTGVTPATLQIKLDATNLPIGFNSTYVNIQTNAGSLQVPIKLELSALKLTHIRPDRASATVYAISEDTAQTVPRAYLLEIDSAEQKIRRVTPVGSSVTDMAIHYPDNKIYVTNWAGGSLLEVDRVTLRVISAIPFTPSGAVGYMQNDVYRVAAGVSKRLVVEEYDQWIDISLFNPVTKTTLDREGVREGGGAFEPTGRYYYHGENNSSGASIQKFDTAGDAFTMLAEVRPSDIASYYGSRTVTISDDGQRIFWSGVMFDANLASVWRVGDMIYSTSGDGRFAFGQSKIYDTNVRRQVLQMPGSTTVSGFSAVTNKLIAQVGTQIRYYNFATPIVLQAPVLTAGTVTGTQVQLSWTDDTLETEFQLQYRQVGTETWSSPISVAANLTTSPVTGLAEGKVYEFRLRASSPEYSSTWSNLVTATTPYTPPSKPSLSSPTTTYNSVTLQWTDLADETGYVLERSPNGTDSWSVISTAAANTVNFIDLAVVSGGTYHYRLKAVKYTAESMYSNVRVANTPLLTAPSTPSISVTIISSSLLKLNWSNISNETGYRLERHMEGQDWEVLSLLGANVVSYEDSTVTTGVKYYYRVAAFNAVGDSGYSSEVSATPIDLVTLLADDFDPSVDPMVWTTIKGGTAVNGGLGFNGSKALWFGASGERSAATAPMTLLAGSTISFKIRAGNTAIDGSYWENSESGESVYLEYSKNGVNWSLMTPFTTSYPNLSSWSSYTLPVPSGATGSSVQVRWRQLANSGASQDTWALDDIVIRGPAQPPTPPMIVFASAGSSSSISLLWFGVSSADSYVIERKTLTGFWGAIAVVGDSVSDINIYSDTGLFPGVYYVYRIKSRNAAGDSLYSPVATAQTLPAYVGWLLQHYETTDEAAIQDGDVTGTHPLLRYAFNLGPDDPLLSVNDTSTSGMPRQMMYEGQLCLEYVRHREQQSIGIKYMAEFSTDFSIWVPSNEEIMVEILDESWERVMIVTPLTNAPNQFGRVRVVPLE